MIIDLGSDSDGELRHNVAHVELRITYRNGAVQTATMTDVDDAQFTFDTAPPGNTAGHITMEGEATFRQLSVERS